MGVPPIGETGTGNQPDGVAFSSGALTRRRARPGQDELRKDHFMQAKSISVALVVAAMALSIGLSACNTVEGVGKDVSATGTAVSDTAKDAKN
jgi:predicted small secreted protein